MHWVTKKETEKLEEFLAGTGKKILFYHRDADGVCSAALFLKFFPDFKAVPREGPRIEDSFVKEITKEKPDLIVFLDLPVCQEWKSISRIKKKLPKLKIIVIDHHIIEKNLNSGDIIHLNPKFRRDVYWPVSYLVFDLLERMGRNVSGLIWIAAMGVIGDYGFKDCRKFLERCAGEYPGLLERDISNSKLANGSELISAAITMKGLRGAKKALEILLESNTYSRFEKSSVLKRWKNAVGQEMENVIRDFEYEREEYPELNLIIYQIHSKLNLVSATATYFSERYPEKIIMIVKKGRDNWKISARNQSGKINMGNLVKKCMKGIGSGGGHIKAAGGMTENFEKFRKRFLKELAKAA